MPSQTAFIEHPMAILAVFFAIIVGVYHAKDHPTIGKAIKYVPPTLFAYFLPTLLTAFNILPLDSPLYKWIKTFLLPVSLFLFTVSLDLPAVLRLGPKAIWVFLAGAFGIVIGGPISLLLFKQWLPPDAWQGMAALSGSWIGGGANFVAIAQAVKAPDSVLGPIIVVDVVVSSVWMGFLIFLAQKQESIDAWFKADNSSIKRVQDKIQTFQNSVTRVSSFEDFVVTIGLAFIFTWISFWLGNTLPPIGAFIDATTWRIILITTFGVLLSFTKVRNYEGAGASKLGNLALYLLITTIGAQANLRGLMEYPVFILAGAVWMTIHCAITLIAAKYLRAPIFFSAVGSQANVGGAASAPVVAAAFHPALAPVGVLLAVLGYVLGTYCGLLCSYLLHLVS